jgi:hypothetical protein
MKQFNVLFTMLCFAFCANIFAQERTASKNVEVTASELIARAGAAKEFRSLGTFKRGDVIPVFSTSGDWYETKCPEGLKVYVFQKFITVTGNDGVISGENVNGRADASEESQILFKFPSKTSVSVLGVKEGWVLIAPPPQATAWVAKQFTKDTAAGVIAVVPGDKSKKGNTQVNEDEDNQQPKTTSAKTNKQVATNNKNNNTTPPANSEINKYLEEQNRKKEQIRQETAARQKEILAGEKEDKFLKTGWVRRVGRQVGITATHALYLSKGTDICTLISNDDSIKIEDFAGKYVGIKGEDIGKEKRSDVPLIKVNSIVLLENGPDKIRLLEPTKTEGNSNKEEVIDATEDK